MADIEFGQIPFELICRFGELTKNEIQVVSYLYACRNQKTKQCNPSRKTISADTKIHKAHLSTTIKNLEDKCWITEMKDGDFILWSDLEIDARKALKVTESVTFEQAKSYGIGNTKVTESVTKVTESVTESYGIGNSHIKDLEQRKNRERTEKTQTQRARAVENIKGETFVQESEAKNLVSEILDGLRSRTKMTVLPNESQWFELSQWAFVNKITAERVLLCYDTLERQRRHPVHWRKGRTTAKTVMDNLPGLEDLVTETNDLENGGKSNDISQKSGGNDGNDGNDSGAGCANDAHLTPRRISRHD